MFGEEVWNRYPDERRSVQAHLLTLLDGGPQILRERLNTFDRERTSRGLSIAPLFVILTSRLGSPTLDETASRVAAGMEAIRLAFVAHRSVQSGRTTRFRSHRTNHYRILLGDAWYVNGIRTLLEAPCPGLYDVVIRSCLSITTGELRSLGTERPSDISTEFHLGVIGETSGTLLSASCQAGALLAGLDRQTRQALAAFGMAFGLLYHLAADIQRVITGDPRDGLLGFPGPDDLAQTVPAVYGHWTSEKEPETPAVRRYLVECGAVAATARFAMASAEDARAALDPWIGHPFRQTLIQIVEGIVGEVSHMADLR